MSKVLESYFEPEAIQLAFNRVKCWSDKLVKDQVGLRAFGFNLENNAKVLSEKVISGKYKAQRGFKFYVPKASFTNRTKTMLNVEDAIIYQAIADKIAASCYDLLSEQESFVFGSVLSPDVKKGTEILKEYEPNYFFFKFWKNLFSEFKDSIIDSIEKDKVQYKFETDITGFFDCIPHYNLLEKLSSRFNVEDEILDLLSNCLNIWSGTKDSITPGVGIPQGPAPSFLLANLILHDLDELIIDQGFKYYRYMDDIKIYGFDESELLESLVIIDKYLKGNGLSINSKKTKIEKVAEDTEDATVKELKKVDAFSIYGDEEEGLSVTSLDELIEQMELNQKESKLNNELKEVYNLSDQSQEIENESNSFQFNVIKNPEEIAAYWKDCIAQVEDELPNFFKNPKEGNLELMEEIDDIDFIRLSAIYSNAIRSLENITGEKILPSEELLKYWLYAYRTFFWRSNCFGLTLNLYFNNQIVKKELLSLIKQRFKLYEWSSYFAFQTLSFTFNFTDKELRQEYLGLLKSEESDLVKISIYRLLIRHSKNEQFDIAIKRQLHKESNQYLKVLVTDFFKNQSPKSVNMVEFLNSIGL